MIPLLKIFFSVWFPVLGCFLLTPQGLHANEARAALQSLNQIRVQTGMTPFKSNQKLQQSAQNHAIYLVKNSVIGHLQEQGRPYFSGEKPGDRAIAVGYEVRNVTENFSAGQKNALQSIEGLMSAIYHRFGFLDFSKNEIGIAYAPMENGFSFVYNMGNDQLNRFCRFAIDMREGAFYKDMCRRSQMVSATKFDQLEQQTRQTNPAVVIWPPDGSENIAPAFFEEIPDPLPNLSVSGYPLSIQFNPADYDEVKLLKFVLFDEKTGQKVHPVHLMHKRNDPNHKFTANQFALFPLNRLHWGTWYNAEMLFQHRGETHQKQWRFKTKEPRYPMFRITAHGELLNLKAHQTYLVYIPPHHNTPIIEQLRWESPATVQPNVDWKDQNTILLTLSGEPCQQADFSLNGQRHFSVQLAEEDNLNSEHDYPQTPALSCVLKSMKGMAGFRIAGQGETLQIEAGREYWIEVDSTENTTENIQLQYSPKMQIDVKHLSQNIIKVLLAGQAGQRAVFYLNHKKTFTLELTN